MTRGHRRSLWRSDLPWIGVLVVISATVFGVAAFLDPEPYHDGSQLPAAIAVSEGLVVHRDVFSGYGFLTAWLQGAAVSIFGPYLLVIRLFTAVTLVLVTALLFILVRRTAGSPVIAFMVAAFWVVAWPGQAVVWGTPLLPWPSVVFLVFQLGAVLLALGALESPLGRTRLLVLAGLMTGLAILTRINYGAALALALLVSLVLVRKTTGIRVRDIVTPIMAAIAVIVLSLIVVTAQGAFMPFLDQSILGPLQGKATVKPTEWFYIENGYLWGSLGILIVSLTVWFLAARTSISRARLWWFSGVGVFVLTLWASAAIESSPVRTLILGRLTWAPAMDVQAMQPMYFSALITIFVAVAVVIRFLLSGQLGDKWRDSSGVSTLTILSLTALASLFQLFPVADPNHLWWAAPIPLALTLFIFTRGIKADRRLPTASVLLLPPLLLAPFTFHQLLERPRVEIRTGVLSGMWVSATSADDVGSVDRVLAQLQPRSAEFDCVEGLFAVWNGHYLASTPGYVNYAYGLDSADPGWPASRRFECRDPLGSGNDAATDAEQREILRDFGDVQLSYFSNMRLVEVAPDADP